GNTPGPGPVIGASRPPPRTRSTDLRLRPDPHIADLLVGRRPPSSSGLGHHPLKVAARVRIPLGVPASKPLVSARNVRLARGFGVLGVRRPVLDRKSTRLNSSHVKSSYAVLCLKKKTESADWSVEGHSAARLRN